MERGRRRRDRARQQGQVPGTQNRLSMTARRSWQRPEDEMVAGEVTQRRRDKSRNIRILPSPLLSKNSSTLLRPSFDRTTTPATGPAGHSLRSCSTFCDLACPICFQIPPPASRLLPLAIAESLSPHSPRTKSSSSFCLHSFADSFRLHQFADSLFEQPPCRRRPSIRYVRASKLPSTTTRRRPRPGDDLHSPVHTQAHNVPISEQA
ncbi:hypothetical protein LXL04_033859 [Taraxacum kok-saghyz]